MRKIRSTTGLFTLSLMAAFFLAACGGGGDSAPDLSPAVTTVAATSVTNSSAVLNGIVNPKGLATTAWFEYNKDPQLGGAVTATAIQSLGSGSADNAITQAVTGLDQGATYYFRAKATSSAGTKVGQIIAFNTLPLPSATTEAATAVTASGAVLHATVNPNGRTTNAWFEYGTTTSLGSVLDNTALGSGTDNVAKSATLSGLNPATTYYYKVVAASPVGTASGATLSFNTAGGIPTVGTKAATLITADGATLNGDVNPSGLPTFAWFEYGTTTSFGSILDNTSRGSGTDNVAASAALSGLAPGTTIYYRIAANNSVGPSLPGDTFNFTTLNPPPVASAGDNQTVFQGRSVTLDGSGSSDGFGGAITYSWSQTAGTTVTLDNAASPTPKFTAPTVAYPSEVLSFTLTVTSSRGPSATDNVSVTVKYGFFDDFSTDTTGSYTVTQTAGTGSTFTWTLDAGAGAAWVQTGVGKALKFQRTFGIPGINTVGQGVFSMIFFPTVVHGAGDGIIIRMGEVDSNAYYEINTVDHTVKKVFGGSTESTPFAFAYVPGNGYTLTIRFSQALTTVEVNGVTMATLNVLDTYVPAYDFTVETVNLDSYYDDIKMEP